jgi:hypothetical protein
LSNGDTQTIDDAFDSQGTYVEALSGALVDLMDLIASAQPYLAAAVAIIELAGYLISLNQPDPTQTTLANVQAALSNLFTELGAANAATALLEKNTTLNGYLANATDALNNLNNAYNDPTTYPPATYINQCIYTLETLKNNNDYVWNTSYSSQDFEQIYWTDAGLFNNVCKYGSGFTATNDAGYGPLLPPRNADGVTVFDYRYSLPVYLDAVSIFLAVLGGLDPHFPGDQTAELQGVAGVLQEKHDQIKSGITLLSPPDWTSVGLVQIACLSPNKTGPPGIRLLYDTSNPSVVVGGMMEYGTVERFSGFSSVGSSYQINLSGNASDSNQALFNKLQIRLLKRTKDVYVGVGLLSILQTSNKLNALLKQPPMPTPTITWLDGPLIDLPDWSFRQIFNLSKLAKNGAGAYSLRTLANFLIQTQPFDTPYTNAASNVSLSFRELLTNFSD